MPLIQKYLCSEAWPFEHTIDDDHDGGDDDDDNNKGFTEVRDYRPGYHAFSNFHNLESHFPLQIWAS